MARADAEGARVYETLLKRAHDDPAILAFWLGGSRGMGRATQYSDYDVGILVADEAYDEFRRELGFDGSFQADWRPGIDLSIATFSSGSSPSPISSSTSWQVSCITLARGS